MCNYKYIYRHSHRSVGKKCPLPEIYSQLKSDDAVNNNAANSDAVNVEKLTLGPCLPLDGQGLCIFHSSDIEWKKGQEFTKRFIDLLNILSNQDDKKSYFDFVEFVFIGDEASSDSDRGKCMLSLTDHAFVKEANFSGARFLDHVEFARLSFKNGASFKHATFTGDIKVEDSVLHGVLFDNMQVEQDAVFENVNFLNSYAIFSDTNFCGEVKFERVLFEGLVDFSGTSFTPHSHLKSVLFRNVTFKDFTNFEDATFSCQTRFDEASFNAQAEFIDTNFNSIKSSYRYRGSAVEFANLTIGKGGLLVFESTDPKNKIFKQEATFSFKEAPEGKVKFENVNFHHIDDTSRKLLLKLSKLGAVEIGLGCIKYRLQTEVRTIEIEEGNQDLALEIAQTFTNYFAAENGRNLGLEILERERGKISFFYFSDEDLSAEEFATMLKSTESNLWDLLRVGANEYQLLTTGQPDNNIPEETESSVINAIDGVSSLIGTFFRVGVRIAFGKWSAENTRNLLDTVDFGGRQRKFSTADLHNFLLGSYTGKALLNINTDQNQGLAPSGPSTQRLASGHPSPIPDPADQDVSARSLSKKRILFLAANPPGSRAHLDLDKEVDRIQINLERSREWRSIHFRRVLAATADRLMQAILDEAPHIVHFAGHGRRGGIVLRDEDGNPRAVTAEALSDLFKLFKDSVECVVLNACFSEPQANAIKEYIPHVIGIKSEIPDEVAIAFSTGFYKAVGAGKTIPFAFRLGIVAVKLSGFPIANDLILV